MSADFNWWECPRCGWDWGNEGYYYVDKGKAIDCTELDEKTNNLVGKAPKGKKVYPVYGAEEFNYGASMNFGGNPVDWTELHKCPKCNIEFEFENSNY